jgi:hypothetical protein
VAGARAVAEAVEQIKYGEPEPSLFDVGKRE